jgi:two-component system, NarL family, sensor histidine kinase DegS
MIQPAAAPLTDLQTETRAELERVEQELHDLKRMVDQSRGEVDKLVQRNAAIAAHVRQIQASLDSVPPADIKAAYEAAQESQQRLSTMRGQLEKLQGEQAMIERLASYLHRTLKAVEASADKRAQGDDMPVIVRVVEAQEAERQRLSRQIHDGPAQALSNFILQTEIAMRLFDIDAERAREELNSLKGAATDTFQKLRDFIFDLRPMMLDDLGLVPTARRYVDAYTEKTGIQVNLVITGIDKRFDPAREVVIFRGLQELLGNIRSHAQATQVEVQMDQDGERVRIAVDDNGKGFDAHTALQRKSKASGLPTLKDRMNLLGGYLQIDSQLGQGTRVVMEVPVGNV